jgi:Na+/melibiose symporter-like transporter
MKNNYQRAYLIIVFAVLTEALAFMLRVSSGLQIEELFFTQNYLAKAAEMTTTVLAAPFLGFAISLVTISPLLDWIGMRNTLLMASLAFIVGTATTILAPENHPDALFYLQAGAFLTGLGWGAVESVINPLVISIYPEDKVRRLNGAHSWWCAGLVLGGLLCLSVDFLQFSFQLKTSIVFIPAVLFGILTLTAKFPVTERVKSGVSTKDMFLELWRRPSFLFWLMLMFLSSLTELGASNFVDIALSQIVGIKGVWILLYVALVMFITRRNAGSLSSRLSPVGVLCVSMLLASIGLYGLSISDSPVNTLCFATLWGIGACLIWPTMMANISYRYPKGGTFFLGLIGLMACLGQWLLIPRLGALYDSVKIETAGGIEQLQQFATNHAAMQLIVTEAAALIFQLLAGLTGLLVVIFGVMWGIEQFNRRRVALNPM